MARRQRPDRVEPGFGRAAPKALAVDPGDRAGGKAARSGGRDADRRSRTSRSGRRRSLTGWLFRKGLKWALILAIWCAIGVGGVVAYYALQLPGGSQWRVPDRPP